MNMTDRVRAVDDQVGEECREAGSQAVLCHDAQLEVSQTYGTVTINLVPLP